MMSIWRKPGTEYYLTKKALKERVKLGDCHATFLETSMHGAEYTGNGEYTIVGPTPYKRVWYATVTAKDGFITKVK